MLHQDFPWLSFNLVIWLSSFQYCQRHRYIHFSTSWYVHHLSYFTSWWKFISSFLFLWFAQELAFCSNVIKFWFGLLSKSIWGLTCLSVQQVRDFHIAKSEKDIGFYAGYLGVDRFNPWVTWQKSRSSCLQVLFLRIFTVQCAFLLVITLLDIQEYIHQTNPNLLLSARVQELEAELLLQV